MKNIILIGLMGCGKSTLGEIAANRLGIRHLDMDRYIENREGLSVSQLFEQYGEPYFREREREAVLAVSEMENTVVSTGGGIVLRPENMNDLKRTGFIVFIDRPLERILSDVDVSGRPLLKGGLSVFSQIADERRALYEKYADRTVKNDKSIALVLEALIQEIQLLRNPKFAVIGDPVDHSLSPDIHLPVLKLFAENPSYERVQVKKGELSGWVDRVKKENYHGFNITMPHKADIIPFLDHIAEEAELAESVNTVINRNGVLYGVSSDAAGFFMALDRRGICDKTAHILIFGAGGAARALAVRAAMDGVPEIGILARRIEAAQDLARWGGTHFAKTNFYAAALAAGEINKWCEKTDILINATPLGMSGASDDWESLDFLACLPKHAAVCDLIYKPERTTLLIEAQRLGLIIQNGLDMLIYQALISDSYFLDTEVNYEKEAETARHLLNAKGIGHL